MNRGDRIIVVHGNGEALASVQRFVVGQKTMKVRKWRTSRQAWSSVITIPVTDVKGPAPIEEDDHADNQ